MARKDALLQGSGLRQISPVPAGSRCRLWAVQKWIGLNEQSGGDPFSVLPIMSAERVKRATQITNDLCLDLQTVDIGIETPGLLDLFNSVDDLRRRLATLLKREI
jgi:hypothetical protein